MTQQEEQRAPQVRQDEGKGEVRSAAKWRRLVEDQAKSGMTQKAFCQQQGIPFHSFHYWKQEKLPALSGRNGSKQREGAPRRRARSQTPGFVPVEVVPDSSKAQPEPGRGSGVEILLPRGLRVGLQPDFDDAVLRQVLEVLGC